MVNSGKVDEDTDDLDENHDSAAVSRTRSPRRSLGGSARAAVTWGLGAGENAFRQSRSMSESSMDDEEALKWAALERLPTFDRLRTTIMVNLEGTKEQVDLRTLSGGRLRSELVGRLFKDADDDVGNAAFLAKLRRRIDRVGIKLPAVEVRYENLSVEARVRVGGRALPSLINSAVNAVEAFSSSIGMEVASKKKMTILHSISGVIKPGRMTLLLGPPSSGKTTLLLALAGKLDPTLKVNGNVTYNGRRFDEFVPQKTSAFVSQNDLHTPQMTVRETLEYSAKSQNVGADTYDLLTELHRKEKELNIKPDQDIDYYLKASSLKDAASSVAAEYTMKILGLDICSEIFIGDEMLRGISGGQKKRVTTGEMIVGPMKTLFMDEISTGLDSSTTYQIVRYLGNITHTLDCTMLISLLQPAPETYDLFDDVILLSEGQIAYHGPRELVLDFFESCGFKCPERKGEADFLQEVTSWKDQEQYWADKSRPYEFVPVRQFAEIFSKCQEGLYMSKELGSPFDASEFYDRALSFQRFPLTIMEMVKINFAKEFLLFRRNAFIYIFKTCQISFAALLGMATYFRTQMHRNSVDDAYLYAGAIFFSIGNFLFNGYAELALMIVRLPVFYRQRDQIFFPAWCYTTANWLLSVPISFVEVLVWNIVTYYPIGFAPAASRFFRQLLLYFWMHQTASLLFRVLGGVCRSMVLSNTAGTFTLLVFFTLGGYIIRRQDIKAWWIWGYYCSPLTYAQIGASVVEFLSPQWDKVIPGTSEPLGIVYLKAVGIVPKNYWYWISVAALIGFTFVFYVLFTLALTFLNPLGKAQAHLSEEQRAEAHANLTGEILPIVEKPRRSLSSTGSMSRSMSRTGGASVLRRSGLSMSRKDGSSPDSVGSVELHGRKSDVAIGRKSDVAIDRKSDVAIGRKSDVAIGRKSDVAIGANDKTNDEIMAIRSRASESFQRQGESLQRQGRPSAAFSFQGRSSLVSNDMNGVGPKRGMVLPFKPLAISFDDVQYSVDMPAQMKAQGATEDKLQLLNGITGAFRPGLLTALVGVSGAGKTTLMDVLAGRKTGGYIKGDIRIAGFPKKQETFARISGYCEQTDVHSPQLTVHESILFSAWLRLGQDVDDDTKAQFVLEVMSLVELMPITDALVGLPGITGLSTEQRKRLTIAVELVANPSIIFMDEPTSGLDARAAAIVMRTVRNTVDTGRTVVCTIHQPSIDIFEAFDDLLLLKRGGQVIYAGRLGTRSHKLVEFFEAVPGVPKIRDGYNPATWMLEISSQGAEGRLGIDFAEVYEKSLLYKNNKALVQALKTPAENAEDLWFPTQYSQSFWAQTTSCLWKQNLTYWRSPEYNNVRIVFSTFSSLLFGTLFWRVGERRDTQSGVASTAGALVGAVLFVGINSASTVQPVVATERTVFYRERGAGMYAAAPYAVAQVLIEVPYLLVITVIYSLITYSMLAFEWTAAKFFWYFYFMFFAFAYFTYYGMMSVGITPNHQISSVVSAFFYQIWNLFSGYLVTRQRAPHWVSWYFWASPTAWTLYGLVISQLGDVDTPLRLTEGSTFSPGVTVAEYVKKYFGFKSSFLGFSAAMHVFFTGFFAVIFMISIKYLNFQKR